MKKNVYICITESPCYIGENHSKSTILQYNNFFEDMLSEKPNHQIKTWLWLHKNGMSMIGQSTDKGG